MSWSISDAKARLSALLADVRGGPQVIENRGEPVAVVLSIADYAQLQLRAAAPRPTPMQTWLASVEALKANLPYDAGNDLPLTLPLRELDDRAVPNLGGPDDADG